MARPGGEIADAGGHSHLRASHADREQVIGLLKVAFVQGRLDSDEFGLRVGQALASRTYAELAGLTSDLPAGLTDSRPLEPRRGTANKKALAALACATVALVGVWPVGMMTPDSLVVPVTAVVAVWLASVLMGWPVLFLVWLDKRTGGQSERRPPGRWASQRPASAGPGKQRRAGHDPRHTAEAAPILRPRRLMPS